jgi:hypothetical protein
MADDVAITAGVGTTIATDDVGGRQFQRVKLDIGGDGVTTPVLVTAPMPVQHQLNPTDLTEVAINIAASGDNSIVAATAAQIIRVWAFWLKINGSGTGVSLKFRSAANDLHPAIPFNDKDGWVMGFMSRPWFTCTVAEALQINLSAAIQVSGRLYYTKG